MTGRICALAISLIGFLASGSTAQSVIFGSIQSPVNGHSYSVLSNSSWTDARIASQVPGGSLATVRSAAEEAHANTFTWGERRDIDLSKLGEWRTE